MRVLLFVAFVAAAAFARIPNELRVPKATFSLLARPVPDVVAKAGPYAFPLYKQCDPRWGSDMMGVNGDGERNTICNEGCAMSSTAMALAGLGVTLEGAPVNPGSFNRWLKYHNGYLCMAQDCNNLNLTAPERLSSRMNLIGETQKPAFATILADIADGAIVHVAHVRHNSHFVLLLGNATAADGREAFAVNDPGFNQSSYTYDEVSDIIRFKVDKYPVYKQCNSSWGSNVMGQNGDTICQVGCLMSSISSALAGTSIQVEGQLATPATVNHFLRTHNGFISGDSALKESVIPLIAPGRVVWPADGMHTSNDIPLATIKQYLDQPVPRICIANVMHGGHFVLVVGYRADNDTLVINDSGFDRNTYSYSNDVVGWRIFDMH